MSELWALFLAHQGRVAHKWPQYFPAYERHFARYVNRPVVLLEIGIGDGGSLQLWKQYFGPYAQIIGLDIEDKTAFREDQVVIRIGHQSDPAVLQTIIDEFGAPDIVIDDGSHQQVDLEATFRYLYPRLQRDGVYVVEDVHTAYWSEYGGALHQPDSFVELAKRFIDDLNADHTRGQLEATEFTRSTLSMHFYDSMIVFERGPHPRALSLRVPLEAAPESVVTRFHWRR